MRKFYNKRIVIGTVAAVGVLATSATIVSCASLQSTAGTKYLGPRTTLRFYNSTPSGNSYVGQNMWFTNPDTNYSLNSNLMGNEMNDSTHNPLIRPVNIGVAKQDASYNANPADAPKIVNNGYKTMTYYKMVTAGTITVTTKSNGKFIYTNDITPAPIKDEDADKPPKRDVPFDSINSTPENVKDSKNGSKSFSAVMKGDVTNIAFTIRKDAYWSTNMGDATNIPVTPNDYWYGLQISHLANPGYRFAISGKEGETVNGGGNTTWDSQMNQNQGGQTPPKGAGSDSWTDSFAPYSINTNNFLEPAKGSPNEFTRNKAVNIDFKSTAQQGDALNAWVSLFINQQYFNARSVVQVNKMNQQYSTYVDPTTMTGKYGYYSYAFAAYAHMSNILFASEYTCEGLFSSITVFHRARGLGRKGQSTIGDKIFNKHTIKNVVWNFSKQIDTFPATQYQKYVQGSTINMDKYALLSDSTKNVINKNRNTMGVHYDKNIYSQLNIRETTWSTLLAGSLDMASSGDPYYNNAFTEAMYGESLADTMKAQAGGDSSYFKHYYTYGTALRSSLSSAINWYTSILNIFKGANSNWGSNFAPNMNIKGSNGDSQPILPDNSSKGTPDPTQSSMSNEYSYGFNGTKLTDAQTETPKNNIKQFSDHFDKQQLSSQALNFLQIQKNIKTTLDNLPNKSEVTKDNPIMFELPVRSFQGTASELLGLENMRRTLNKLDPRIHVAAKLKYNPSSKKVVVDHDAYDAGYTMEWTNETLPRLLSLRSPTQAQYNTHYYANTLPGLGGFLSDMLNFNQYGGLTGFSTMLNPATNTVLPTTGHVADTAKWVKGDFYTQWQAAKAKVIQNATNTNVKAALNAMNIKNFWKTSSGPKPTGLLGPALNGENYSAFAPATTTLTSEERTLFNGEFKRIINNTIKATVANFAKNKTTDQIKSILAGIDTYFGRPLGYLYRKIDNQIALPIKLQKTWYNDPRPDSGVAFTDDDSVDV